MPPRMSDLDSDRGRFCQLHRALKLGWVLFASEILGVKFRDVFHIVAGQRWRFWRLGEFNELFFVINVRQSGSDPIVSQQPLQRRLTERAIGTFQETQLLDLFHAVEEPTTGPVRAMIAWRENRLGIVFSLEHSG